MTEYDKELINRLNDLIKFPTIYTFKVVGLNTESFKKDIHNLIRNYLQDLRKIEIRQLVSRKKKYSSLSIQLRLDDVNELLDIYALLKREDNIKFIL